jgi:hypothetical protein
MVCFRYVIVHTLHKGDNKDDNDDDTNNNNNNNNNNNKYVAYTLYNKDRITGGF